MKEIFKDVKGYEGIYKISNLGTVLSLKFNKRKELKSTVNNTGYKKVMLSKEGKVQNKKIHKLVAESFLNHTPCGYKLVVNHIDNNPLNNQVDNLEVVTHRQNTNKKHIKSSSKYVGVSFLKGRKKWTSTINIKGKRKHLGHFNCETKAHLVYQKELAKL